MSSASAADGVACCSFRGVDRYSWLDLHPPNKAKQTKARPLVIPLARRGEFAARRADRQPRPQQTPTYSSFHKISFISTKQD